MKDKGQQSAQGCMDAKHKLWEGSKLAVTCKQADNSAASTSNQENPLADGTLKSSSDLLQWDNGILISSHLIFIDNCLDNINCLSVNGSADNFFSVASEKLAIKIMPPWNTKMKGEQSVTGICLNDSDAKRQCWALSVSRDNLARLGWGCEGALCS